MPASAARDYAGGKWRNDASGEPREWQDCDASIKRYQRSMVAPGLEDMARPNHHLNNGGSQPVARPHRAGA